MNSQENLLWGSPGMTLQIAFSRHVLTLHSSLVLRFVKDQFDDYRESTIGGPCHTARKTSPQSNLSRSCISYSNRAVGGWGQCQVRDMVNLTSSLSKTEELRNCRDTAGQERYKVCRCLALVAPRHSRRFVRTVLGMYASSRASHTSVTNSLRPPCITATHTVRLWFMT